jgi:hypothetical protein
MEVIWRLVCGGSISTQATGTATFNETINLYLNYSNLISTMQGMKLFGHLSQFHSSQILRKFIGLGMDG